MLGVVTIPFKLSSKNIKLTICFPNISASTFIFERSFTKYVVVYISPMSEILPVSIKNASIPKTSSSHILRRRRY